MAIWSSGSRIVDYRIEVRPRRRHAAIEVAADGRVTVLLPPDYPASLVPRLLDAHGSWILRRLAIAEDVSRHPPALVSGATLAWWGEPLYLRVSAGDGRVRRLGSELWVERRPGDEGTQTVRAALKRWFVEAAGEQLPARMEGWSRAGGLRPARLKIAEYKTRWGFCRVDGLIALDFRLIQAPPEVVDYVLVHELMHLRFPHHRPPFWRAVGQILPDAVRQRQWLRREGSRLRW